MRDLDAEHLSGGAPAGERGFTIVEVVAAVGVMLVGLLSLLGLFNDSRDQNETGERTEIAVLQAEQAIEELRSIPYAKLMMNAGAVDPGGGRVVSAGAQFKVKPDKTEPLVYYSTEGKALADAWVAPVSNVTIGPAEAPLDLTIHRFVTWRDEECRIADLGEIGVDLPAAIQTSSGLLTNLVNSITTGLLGLLNPTLGNKTTVLKNRLNNVKTQLASVSSALAGVSELDLCDADLSVLEDVQNLDSLTSQLPVADGLVTSLQGLLDTCLPLLCSLTKQNQISTAIDRVNGQLNCMFESSGSSGDTTYLQGLVAGINDLASDLSNTVKNSKRITVGVVVEPRPGVTPVNPLWISTVVRDPSAGLLTTGGASCA